MPPLDTPPLSGHGVKRFFAAALLAAVMACDGSSGVAVIEHSAAISEGNSLIAYVDARLSQPARALIEYQARDGANMGAARPKYRTPFAAAAANHRIPVVRLRAETAYRYSVGVEGPAGLTFVADGEFATGRLPEELRDLQITAVGKSAQELILTDYNPSKDTDDKYLFALNEDAEIVWHYKHRKDESRPETRGTLSVKRNARGNFVYIAYECCIIEITPLGEEARQLVANDTDGAPHHDFVFLDDGRILYPAWVAHTFDDTANGGEAETVRNVDTLRVWDPINGGDEKVWDSRDHWDITDPAQRVRWNSDHAGWTHLNSLSVGAGGNIILNLRNRNQVVALSPDFSTILWKLGGPDGDFHFPDIDDVFFFAHTVSELPDGNILLFDNGMNYGREHPMRSPYITRLHTGTALEGRTESRSRALELRLDKEAGTATKVWEYRATPDHFSHIVSSAYRLANGNTLISFGTSPDTARIPNALMEVSPSGETLYRVDFIDPGRADGRLPLRYRAYALDSIMGETRVE